MTRDDEPNAVTLSGGLDPQLRDALDRLAMAHDGLSKQTIAEAAQAVYERWRVLHVGRAPAEFLNEAAERARERSEAHESGLDQHLFPGMFGSGRFPPTAVDMVLSPVAESPRGDAVASVEKARDTPVPSSEDLYWDNRCGICMKTFEACDCHKTGRR